MVYHNIFWQLIQPERVSFDQSIREQATCGLEGRHLHVINMGIYSILYTVIYAAQAVCSLHVYLMFLIMLRARWANHPLIRVDTLESLINVSIRLFLTVFSKQIRLFWQVLTPSRAILTSISTSKRLY